MGSFSSGITHCASRLRAFHRAHRALYTHHLLESTDSDWGICEVNLMPCNDRVLIENLKTATAVHRGGKRRGKHRAENYRFDERSAASGNRRLRRYSQRDGASADGDCLSDGHGKGYCADAASGQLDLNNPLIKHDLENPTAPKSAIGYIVEALRLRREKGLKAFTVMSCDNVRENGHVAKVAVLGLAQARDPQLAAWIEENVTFPCTMVDRIVPAATPETLQEIADQLGVYDPCAIACEPFRQWVIEDNFVNGRPDWDKVGAQFVADVVPFEMMKLRMLNGSHSFPGVPRLPRRL